MSAVRHTPQPWFATYFYAPDRRRLIETSPDGGGTGIALVLPGPHFEGNVKLVAAAPRLADELVNASGALKLVLNQLAQHEEGSVHADRALAAIDAVLRAAGRLP